jgi:hypothetical protein
LPIDEIDLGCAIGLDHGRTGVVALGFAGAKEEAVRIAVVVGDAAGARRAIGVGPTAFEPTITALERQTLECRIAN